MPESVAMPPLPAFTSPGAGPAGHETKDLRSGWAVDLGLTFEAITPGQILLDSRTGSGQGLCLQTTSRGTVEIVLNDGRSESRWDCDPGLLAVGRPHHLVVNVDGGPKIIMFIVDGKLCDGGAARQFGWGRFSPNLRDVNGARLLRIGPSFKGRIHHLRVYSRCLHTSEAVGNYRASGLTGHGP
jgi:hypothetical protein